MCDIHRIEKYFGKKKYNNTFYNTFYNIIPTYAYLSI